MATIATIRVWHDEGWGVVDSPETPGGCWAHFSDVPGSRYIAFAPGDPVWLDWESPGQDGYPYRATQLRPRDEREGGAADQ